MRRRELLQAAATLPLPHLIAAENRKPGTASWQLTKVWPNRGKGYRSALIEGYCGRQSVEAGQPLTIHVSTNPARRFTIDIFRMGYYGGAGARHMTQLGPFQGKPQDDPPIGPNRLRECRWEPSTTLNIPPDWPSGVYLGKLTCIPESAAEHPWQSYIVFIVKDRRRAQSGSQMYLGPIPS